MRKRFSLFQVKSTSCIVVLYQHVALLFSSEVRKTTKIQKELSFRIKMKQQIIKSDCECLNNLICFCSFSIPKLLFQVKFRLNEEWKNFHSRFHTCLTYSTLDKKLKDATFLILFITKTLQNFLK